MRRLAAVIFQLTAISAAGTAACTQFSQAPVQHAALEEQPLTVQVARGDVVQSVTAPGTLTGTRVRVLSFDVGGRLADVVARPGESVRAGALLATLQPEELRSAVQDRQHELDIARLQLHLTQRGPSEAERRAARATLSAALSAQLALNDAPPGGATASADAALRNAELNLKQAQYAYDNAFRGDPAAIGASPAAAELERATLARDAARVAYDALFEAPTAARRGEAAAQVAQAQARLSALAPLSETVALARMRVEHAELALLRAEQALRKIELRAPFDGVVIEVPLRDGEALAAGQAAVTLADPRALEVQASVIEEDLPLVNIGHRVELYLDAAPDVQIDGVVTRIVPQRLAGDRPLYPVYVSLDHVPAGVVSGMSVEGSIVIDKRSGVLFLPRAVVQPRSDGSATVEVFSNGARETRTIKIGLRGDVAVEVLSGLSEGERVVSR